MNGFSGPLLLVLTLAVLYALWHHGARVRSALGGATSLMPETPLTKAQWIVLLVAGALTVLAVLLSPTQVGAFGWYYWLPLVMIGAAAHACIALSKDDDISKDSKKILKRVVWGVVGIFLIGYPLLGWSRTVSLASKVRCPAASSQETRTCVLTAAGSEPIATDSSVRSDMTFCVSPFDQIDGVRYPGKESTFGITPKALPYGKVLVVRYKAMYDCSKPMD